MKREPFNYLQMIVALGLIAMGAFLLMTGTALIAVVVATVAFMLLFFRFLFTRKAERPVRKPRKNDSHKRSSRPRNA